MLTQQNLFLIGLGAIGLLLLIGTYLRGRIKLFQTLYFPASVIGGFVGFIALQLYIYFFPQYHQAPDSTSLQLSQFYALLPALLIMPIVASAPLGLRFSPAPMDLSKKIHSPKNKSINEQVNNSKRYYVKSIFAMFSVFGLIFSAQLVVGLLTGILFGTAQGEFYSSLGIELMLGFTGGHGLVGLVANPLKAIGSDFWEISQGIAATTATAGLVLGLLLGILFINIAVFKKWITIDPQEKKEEHASQLIESQLIENKLTTSQQQAAKKGYYLNPEQQMSLGKETTDASSISTLALHVAIIFMVCAASSLIIMLAKAYQIPLLKNFSAWGFAVLLMFGVWGLMNWLKIDHLIDEKVKNQIASLLMEVAIVAAIVSLPIQAILSYWQPILTMIILGVLVTLFISRLFSPLAYEDNVIAREASILGTSMGVFITGLALLKICDPKLKTPVFGHYAVAYAFSTLIGVLVLGTVIQASIQKGAIAGLYASLILTLAYFICVLISIKLKKHCPKVSNNEEMV